MALLGTQRSLPLLQPQYDFPIFTLIYIKKTDTFFRYNYVKKKERSIKTDHYFFSQVHQPFFLFGIVWAVVDMVLFMLSYRGIFIGEIAPSLFHAYSMIFIVLTHFFIGFLFTTYPRFTQTPIIEKEYYLKLFALFELSSTLYTVGYFLHVDLLYLGSVGVALVDIVVVYKLYGIFTESPFAKVNSDTFWILVGFFASLVSQTLFALAYNNPKLLDSASFVGFYMYIVFVAFVIAQRMVPFFSHSMVPKVKNFTLIVSVLLLLKLLGYLGGFVLFEAFVDFALAAFMLKEFLRWQLRPFHSEAILWVLHLALFWLPVALVLGALGSLAQEPDAAMQTHLVALGFIVTILIGFGTRVTLGHSAQPPFADAFATKIFLAIQILVFVRALYSFVQIFGVQASWLFDISAVLWIGIFVLWSKRYAKVLTHGVKLQ